MFMIITSTQNNISVICPQQVVINNGVQFPLCFNGMRSAYGKKGGDLLPHSREEVFEKRSEASTIYYILCTL